MLVWGRGAYQKNNSLRPNNSFQLKSKTPSKFSFLCIFKNGGLYFIPTYFDKWGSQNSFRLISKMGRSIWYFLVFHKWGDIKNRPHFRRDGMNYAV